MEATAHRGRPGPRIAAHPDSRRNSDLSDPDPDPKGLKYPNMEYAVYVCMTSLLGMVDVLWCVCFIWVLGQLGPAHEIRCIIDSARASTFVAQKPTPKHTTQGAQYFKVYTLKDHTRDPYMI